MSPSNYSGGQCGATRFFLLFFLMTDIKWSRFCASKPAFPRGNGSLRFCLVTRQNRNLGDCNISQNDSRCGNARWPQRRRDLPIWKIEWRSGMSMTYPFVVSDTRDKIHGRSVGADRRVMHRDTFPFTWTRARIGACTYNTRHDCVNVERPKKKVRSAIRKRRYVSWRVNQWRWFANTFKNEKEISADKTLVKNTDVSLSLSFSLSFSLLIAISNRRSMELSGKSEARDRLAHAYPRK